MITFFYIAGIVAIIMLIWDTIEVGRNDAANIVNAVFGARVMRRKLAVYIAGLAVILGAWASSPVIETARKEIFFPQTLSLTDALSIYMAVYLTDTVLLYSFSAFGMPISTTACLVFSLLGGGFVLGGIDTINIDKSLQVILAIILSIFISGAAGFLIQRAFRGAIGQHCDDRERVSLHGPWIGGLLLTGLFYFLLMKGMKNIGFVKGLREITVDDYGVPIILIGIWALLSILVWIILRLGKEKALRNLFAGFATLGMLATAFAFGQNDLANCASPGVASWLIIRKGELAIETPVPSYLLLICGCLLAVGMATRTAQRVTRAEVNTGSQGDIVRLYAPRWCIWIAQRILPERKEEALAPEDYIDHSRKRAKVQHYDALRAAVITSVSGSIIAFASSLGLPVSTTYVAFAAVIATGWADKIFVRGDAYLKLGRTIWVIFCWFFSALLAACITGMGAFLISRLQTIGILIGLAANLSVRHIMKKRSDRQEALLQEEAAERKKKFLQQTSNDIQFATETDSDEM